MSTLPAAAYVTNSARTQAEVKAALEAWRYVTAELPGGTVETAITIDVSGQIAPTVGIASLSLVVFTGVTDDLGKIDPTNARPGCIYQLRAADPAKPIVVKHRVGGSWQISLLGDADYTLDDDDKCLFVMYNPATLVWEEVAPGSMRVELMRMLGFKDAVTLAATTNMTVTSAAHTLTGTANIQRLVFPANGCGLVLFRSTSGAQTFKNATGGGAMIYTRDGGDIVLNATNQYVLFEKRGADAYEVERFGLTPSHIYSGGRMSTSNTLPYNVGAGGGGTGYFHPYGPDGNRLSVYTSASGWVTRTFSLLSLAVPASPFCMFYRFVYDNAGVLTLEDQRWDSGSPYTRTISGISIAADMVITTSTSHGLAVGDEVFFSGIVGTVGTDLTTGINTDITEAALGFRVLTVPTGTTFTIGVASTGKTYTSGGTMTKLPAPPALGVQDNIVVKSGDPTRRLVGIGLTNTNNEVRSTDNARHFVSHLNPVYRPGAKATVATHNTTSTTPILANNAVRSRKSWLTTQLDVPPTLVHEATVNNAASAYGLSYLWLDGNSGALEAAMSIGLSSFSSTQYLSQTFHPVASIGIGYHYACLGEFTSTANPVQFYEHSVQAIVPW